MRDLRVSFPRPCDQKWAAMTPGGRARLCARCDKPVHDLSLYSLDEAEALLRRSPGACVRARIDGEGVVALKQSRGSDAGRMVLAVAATAGLLAASAPAAAKQDRPNGAIAGHVDTFGFRTRVKATGPDGRSFRATVKLNGRFRIKRLPSGTYRLTFNPSCGENWTVENVVVGGGETLLPEVERDSGCITIGMLQIGSHAG
jgi:hypothetical protein